MFIETTATRKVLALKKNLRLIDGGTSASKTISIIQVLIDIAQHATLEDSGGLPIDVVSETMPHMRSGAMQDFENIMRSHGYWKEARWNKTMSTYEFETGIKMRFFSADAPSKAHGPRRWILYINEGNNVPWKIADHLMVRTKGVVFIDWNPVEEFWADTEIINNPAYEGKFDYITLTYKDNEALDPVVVERIEAHKGNKMWWQVYGLGQRGEIEGRIYTGWQLIDEIPHEAQLVRRGLDWGFSVDPTAIVDVYRYNGGFIVSERLYRKGMLNNDIAAFLNNLESPSTLVMADSSEPKSIADITQAGIVMLGVEKKGTKEKSYLKHSIEYVQQQKISVTKSSINLIKEYRNYLWMTDKNGKQINEPTPGLDHALDALRYAFDGLRPVESESYQQESVDYNFSV